MGGWVHILLKQLGSITEGGEKKTTDWFCLHGKLIQGCTPATIIHRKAATITKSAIGHSKPTMSVKLFLIVVLNV